MKLKQFGEAFTKGVSGSKKKWGGRFIKLQKKNGPIGGSLSSSQT